MSVPSIADSIQSILAQLKEIQNRSKESDLFVRDSLHDIDCQLSDMIDYMKEEEKEKKHGC